jgi:hypothetical protein
MTAWRQSSTWRQPPLERQLPARRSRRPRLISARLLAAVITFAAVVPEAFAFGRSEKDDEKESSELAASKEWVFCVTAFDSSELPVTQRLIAEISAWRLARVLESVGRRSRSPEEVGAYSDYADAEAREAAGKQLAEKRDARAALLYQGNPGWKYRKELKKADAAVELAEEKLARVQKERSHIEIEAEVVLSKKNEDGALPPAPKAAALPLFCKENKLDALLTGSVTPYYGRMRLKTQLYSRYLRKIIHEDEIVFSSEDREAALAELEGRLRSAVSGSSPAALAISAVPEDADIVVDGKLLGHGAVGPIEKNPEPTKIEVSSPLYETADTTIELASDELTKVSIALKPLLMNELSISAIRPPGSEENTVIEAAGTAEVADVAVRLGALHMGTAPVVLAIPQDKMAFVSLETPDGLGASAVVAEGGQLVLDLKPLPGPEAKPVEKARRKFYNAFGRFSIALPIAFFMSGIALGYENAAIWGGDPDMQDRAESARSYANAAVGVTVAFFADAALRCVVYLRTANQRATPLVKPMRDVTKTNREKGR